MNTKLYHDRIIKYLHLSRQSQPNPHKCPALSSVHLSLSPDSRGVRALSSSASILASISGSPSRVSVRFNRRSKEYFLAGSRMTLRRDKAYASLSSLGHLVFYNSANFRGMLGNSREVGASYRLSCLEFFVAASGAFNGGLAGFGDANSAFFVTLSFNSKSYALFFLRGLKLPAYL